MDHVFRRLPFKELMEKAPVASLLVVINVIVFLYGYVSNEFMGEYELVIRGGIHREWMDYSGEYYRLITSGFIHFDLIHLLFNVGFGIYIISSGLERLIGSVRFAILYALSLLASSVGVYFFEDPTTLTAGASGAIYGVLGALLFITLQRPGMISRGESSAIRNLIFINLVFTFVFSGISVLGHLGGFAAGLVLSFVIIPNKDKPIQDQYVYDYTDNSDEDDWWVN